MDSNTSHLEAIKAVVSCSDSSSSAYGILLSASQERVVYVVNNQDVLSVLDKVIGGALTMDELEMWAHLLEVRKDIDTQYVEGVLYALSHPEQMGELTIDKLTQIRMLLS